MFEMRIGKVSGDIGYLEALSLIIPSIIWPLTVIIVVLVFRLSIINLLTKITSFKIPGAEFKFADVLRDLERSVHSDEASSNDEDYNPHEDSNPNQDSHFDKEERDTFYYMQELTLEPANIIVVSWLQVENAVRRIFKNTYPKNDEMASFKPFSFMLSKLTKSQVISLELYQNINKARRLRNIAVHGVEPISHEEAKRYKDITASIINDLNQAAEIRNRK